MSAQGGALLGNTGDLWSRPGPTFKLPHIPLTLPWECWCQHRPAASCWASRALALLLGAVAQQTGVKVGLVLGANYSLGPAQSDLRRPTCGCLRTSLLARSV